MTIFSCLRMSPELPPFLDPDSRNPADLLRWNTFRTLLVSWQSLPEATWNCSCYRLWWAPWALSSAVFYTKPSSSGLIIFSLHWCVGERISVFVKKCSNFGKMTNSQAVVYILYKLKIIWILNHYWLKGRIKDDPRQKYLVAKLLRRKSKSNFSILLGPEYWN